MVDTLKMLVTTPANRNPSAGVDTTLYTVPALNSGMVTRVMVCNRSATPTTFRIATVESGGTLGNQHYIVFDMPISGNETLNIAIGGGLAAGDSIHVLAAAATLTFTPFGIEVG